MDIYVGGVVTWWVGYEEGVWDVEEYVGVVIGGSVSIQVRVGR
jgi:hypothetical protein